MKKILLFGDSNTFGYRPDRGGRYHADIRWAGIVAQHYRQKGIEVLEEGLSGRAALFDDTIHDIKKGVSVFPAILQKDGPVDLVVIMLGTNDCKIRFHATAQQIAEGIGQLVEQVLDYEKTQSKHDTRILIMSPILLGKGVGEPGFDLDFDGHSEQVAQHLAGEMKKIADRYHCEFLAASEYAKPSALDREHMDEQEHAKLAAAVTDKLDSMTTDWV